MLTSPQNPYLVTTQGFVNIAEGQYSMVIKSRDSGGVRLFRLESPPLKYKNSVAVNEFFKFSMS